MSDIKDSAIPAYPSLPDTLLPISLKLYFSPARTLSYARALLDPRNDIVNPERQRGKLALALIPDFLTIWPTAEIVRESQGGEAVAGATVGEDVQGEAAAEKQKQQQQKRPSQPLPFLLGAQDTHWQPAGAYTGEVSPRSLRQLGVTLVEIGHAERRALFGESDEVTARKARAVTDEGMVPLVCVGEVSAPTTVRVPVAAEVNVDEQRGPTTTTTTTGAAMGASAAPVASTSTVPPGADPGTLADTAAMTAATAAHTNITNTTNASTTSTDPATTAKAATGAIADAAFTASADAATAPEAAAKTDTTAAAAAAVAAAVAECAVQVRAVLTAIPPEAPVVFAYEPVWAIGRPAPASVAHVAGVVAGIRRVVDEVAVEMMAAGEGVVKGGKGEGEAKTKAGGASVRPGAVRVLYGGSAGPGLWRDGGLGKAVDGMFLGRFAHEVEGVQKVVAEVEETLGLW